MAQVTCPCTNNQYSSWPFYIPEFVGKSYFCDTGNRGDGVATTYYSNDPLWDGKGCGPFSNCCQFNSPPWFQTALPQTTSDDIELHLCFSLDSGDEDVIL